MRGRGKRRRWPWVVFAVLVACVLAVAGLFSWNRWLRFDDAADIQGTWQVSGTGATVVIDGGSIQLADDVAYAYELDSGAKTMAFTFGELSGTGRYWLSLDRQTLVLEDGSFSWFSTLTGDVAWTFEDVVATVQGRAPSYSVGAEATVLQKVSAEDVAAGSTAAGADASADSAAAASTDSSAASTDPSAAGTGTDMLDVNDKAA